MPSELLCSTAFKTTLGSPLQEIDLSEYVKRSEIEPRIRSLEEKAHVHYNKDVLDQTSAPYTVQEKEKLFKCFHDSKKGHFTDQYIRSVK